jgi:hypothetical protein
MADTKFMARAKSGEEFPLFKPRELRFGITDSLIIVGVLAAFVGLVLLLSK